MTPARRAVVAHVTRAWGGVSQTFVPALVDAVWREGWEPWVLTRTVEGTGPEAVASDRVVVVRRPALAVRARRRLAGSTSVIERKGLWFEEPLRHIAPDVVHAHFGPAAAEAAPAAGRLGLPLVATFHGFDLTVLPGQERWREPYAKLLPRLACAIVVSRFLEERLREIGYRGRSEVVPTGVDVERVPFRPRPLGSRPRLLFVGRLEAVKGLDVLLAALPEILAARPVGLHVIGTGSEEPRVRALVASLGLEGAVTFLGPRAHGEVLQAMGAADLLVVPSVRAPNGHEESASQVAKEALAMGLPVLASRTGGVPETLPPGQADALVEPGDAEALAGAVLRLLALPEGARELRAREGRAWMEQRFDIRQSAATTAALYRDVVAT